MANVKLIGENIKTLRERMGLNQTSVARFLKVDQSFISKVEKGERTLSADMLEKLTCLFGVSINDMENTVMEDAQLH